MNVSEYMNPSLVYLRSGERVEIATRALLDFGLTVVPILNEEGKPVGVVGLRDLVDERQARPHVARDVRVIDQGATIDEAAQMLATQNLHHLIVVDGVGRAVGMLSSLDVVRGMLGSTPKHPASVRRFTRPCSELDPAYMPE